MKSESWLSELDQNKKFKDLKIIPQTHNSATNLPLFCYHYFIWLFAQCQYLSIKKQLERGIRALDLRLTVHNDIIYIGHHFISHYTLENVLLEVEEFLNENPSEFVCIFMKDDWKTYNWNSEEYKSIWKFFNRQYTIKNNKNIFNTTLKDLQSKIIPIIDNTYIKHIPSDISFIDIDDIEYIHCWNSGHVDNAICILEKSVPKNIHQNK